MNQAQQPRALRLAYRLEDFALSLPAYGFDDQPPKDAAAELRRLHARVKEFEAERDVAKGSLSGLAKRKDDWKWRAMEAEAQLATLLADDERNHSDEDAAIAAGKVQAAVQGRVG